MNLKIAPLALQDLKEIREYITVKLCNPTAAQNTIRRIVDDYLLLVDSPFMGSSLNAKINVVTPYRFLVSGNYLIFYKVDGDDVEICRIINSRRDFIKILFGNSIGNVDYLDDEEYC